MKAVLLIVFASIVTWQFMLPGEASQPVGTPIEGRWYTEAYVRIGKQLYDVNCAVCHGAEGQGLTENWKKPLADGSYPPPPLNGTAHTWHHPMSVLVGTIKNGGAAIGGKMPAFKGRLSTAEKLAIVAYFQNWWSDEIYQVWQQNGGLEN